MTTMIKLAVLFALAAVAHASGSVSVVDTAYCRYDFYFESNMPSYSFYDLDFFFT